MYVWLYEQKMGDGVAGPTRGHGGAPVMGGPGDYPARVGCIDDAVGPCSVGSLSRIAIRDSWLVCRRDH